EPANSRRQTLELNALSRQGEPTLEMRILWKQLQRQRIGAIDVFGIARKGHPTKRPFAFAEQWPNVLRDKSRNVERVLDPGVERDRSHIVAIVERNRAATLHLQHRFHVFDSRCGRTANVLLGV